MSPTIGDSGYAPPSNLRFSVGYTCIMRQRMGFVLCLPWSSVLAGQPCATCAGDLNADACVDGQDIQAFFDAYRAGPTVPPGAACADFEPTLHTTTRTGHSCSRRIHFLLSRYNGSRRHGCALQVTRVGW